MSSLKSARDGYDFVTIAHMNAKMSSNLLSRTKMILQRHGSMSFTLIELRCAKGRHDNVAVVLDLIDLLSIKKPLHANIKIDFLR